MQKMTRQTCRCTTAVVLATLSAGLAACGGGNAGSTVGADSAAGSGAPSDRRSASAQDRWDLKMVRCLRENGIGVDDPKPGDGFPSFQRPVNYREISSRCASEVGPSPSTSRGSASAADLRQGSLTLTRCLRAKGYDVADAAPGQAIAMRVKVKPADLDACLKAQSKR